MPTRTDRARYLVSGGCFYNDATPAGWPLLVARGALAWLAVLLPLMAVAASVLWSVRW